MVPEAVKKLSNQEKGYVLVRALPYIQKYTGKTVVIKYGGNAMINEELKEAVISDIVLLTCVGINNIIFFKFNFFFFYFCNNFSYS